jgi:alginate O-acetyltransferase complex protein AlgI
MLFNSLAFLYAFLPITYLVFWRLKSKTQRYVWLTITGYVFYGFWSWKFCFLMAFSTLVSYLAGLGLLRFPDGPKRKLFLVVPICVDLAVLAFFKYANFALEVVGQVLGLGGVQAKLPHLDVVLPVGISFYTFHTITYVVDSYRRVVTPTRNFFEFSCYVSLFAQLVAGPIVRFRQIEADLEHLDTAKRGEGLDRGWSFFCIGMAKKVLIADTLAALIAPALSSPTPLSTANAWASMLGYTYQLYFDFSGYSDMAIGLGLMFGLRLPQNFNSPYKATDPSDFWKRWHISLSTMLRDYLYIPLGGNREGKLKTHRNLLITMLLGGLWHGANWTFIVWGGYHGALLVLYQATRAQFDKVPVLLRRAITFGLVVVGWTFFRADNLTHATALLRSMFTLRDGVPLEGTALFGALGVAAVIAHFAPNASELKHQWGPLATLGVTAALAASILVIYSGNHSPFLYFQF